MWGPIVFGNQAPDSGNSEILALFGTRGAEGALAAPAARGRHAVRLLDDRARTPRAPTRRCSPPRAVRDGDEWVINGHKWFSSNGSIADFLIAMAVTEPEAGPTSARR